MTTRPKPVVLAILDGWGHAPDGDDNAIAKANTPTMDRLTRDYPSGLINASELHVGLPSGQMGNSEVGHMNIGSGRVLMQELPKIDAAIADGSLAKLPEFVKFISDVKQKTGIVHLLGLLSDGGVHSHQSHIAALAKLCAAAGLVVKLHMFLDGRDTPPRSALTYVAWLEGEIAAEKNISIVTLCGRYYAMDRDKRWDRVEKAYDMITDGIGEVASSAKAAIEQSYAQEVNDEFVLPTAVETEEFSYGMKDGDGLLMANFRSDRVREILTALVDPAFDGFKPKHTIKFSATLGMVEYSSKLALFIPALFPPQTLTHILGEVVADAGLTQLRIAETEKYAHVTFFFNGGRELEFPGESRILVQSPDVPTYDLKPEMSAYEVTQHLVEAIEAERFDLIVVNYANTDMVGHTGNIPATIKAVEAVDECLGKVSAAVLAKGGAMIITADHGNAEQMFDGHTCQAHTAHTLNLVPVIVACDATRGQKITLTDGRLGDIAPTILHLMNLPKPAEMTGRNLLTGS
jgi:2,3-bisphosphoglycerate-independent phosphoglycerate mutase